MNAISPGSGSGGIRVGGRVGFDTLDEMERNFMGIDFPVELALPWKYGEGWRPIEGEYRRIIEFFRDGRTKILSLHATQGKISDQEFMRWGRISLEIARELGARDVTVHPDTSKSQRVRDQEKALRYLRELLRDGDLSVETFGGANRVLRPREIVSFGLPMTLDVAHLHDRNEVLDVVNRYHKGIRTVHLSAIGNGEHHLPIDAFCVEVASLLKRLRWSGNVILEYLPWHHYRVREDVRSLQAFVDTGSMPTLAPPNDVFKKDPSCWGYERR